MNNDNTDENIPILTQIIHSGDASMHNHFDASYFDDDHGLEVDEPLTEHADEKQEPFISDVAEDIGPPDAMDKMVAEANYSTNSLQQDNLKKTIDTIIAKAVQEIIPEIEQKLTQQISQKIYLQFFNKDGE